MKDKLTILTWLLIAGFFFMFSQVAEAQDIEMLGLFSAYNFYALDIQDDYAFLGTNYNRLYILDITDRYNPTLVSQTQTTIYNHRDIAVRGNYLYLIAVQVFAIFDITDLANPVLMGSCSAPHGAAMELQGNYAYVALHQDGLKVIDISDPSNPVVVGQNTTSLYLDISVAGNYAYLAANGAGMIILNISDPTNPILLSITPVYDNAFGIDVQGNLAFVADEEAGLTIIDISNLNSPLILSNTTNCIEPNM